MNHRSIKYFALTTALAGIAAFGTTRVYAEDTPNPTGTDTPVVSTEAPVPSETTEPVATPQSTEAPSAPATQPTSTPDETPAYQNNEAKANIASNAVTNETTPAKTGEQQENGHWIYIDETTGQKITSSFKHIVSLNKTVYYDENGYMVYGLQTIENKTYYFKPGNGAQQYGEQFINGHWYHFDEETGEMSVGITDLGSKKVLYGNNGQMLYSFQPIESKTYYFKPGNGAQQYGEQFINGHWYHFDEKTGEMSVGETDLGSKKVLYSSNGQMLYGLQSVEDKTYYFKPGNGAKQYGEQYFNGHWHYFDKEDGAMAKGLTNIGYKTVFMIKMVKCYMELRV